MGTTTGATLFSDILYKTLLQHFSTKLFSSTSLLLNTWNLHYTERSNPSNAKHNRTTDCGNRTSQHKACNTHYSALSKPNMQIAIEQRWQAQWFPSLEQRHMPTKHNACHEIWRNAEGIHPLLTRATNSEIAPFQSLQKAPHAIRRITPHPKYCKFIAHPRRPHINKMLRRAYHGKGTSLQRRNTLCAHAPIGTEVHPHSGHLQALLRTVNAPGGEHSSAPTPPLINENPSLAHSGKWGWGESRCPPWMILIHLCLDFFPFSLFLIHRFIHSAWFDFHLFVSALA